MYLSRNNSATCCTSAVRGYCVILQRLLADQTQAFAEGRCALGGLAVAFERCAIAALKSNAALRGGAVGEPAGSATPGKTACPAKKAAGGRWQRADFCGSLTTLCRRRPSDGARNARPGAMVHVNAAVQRRRVGERQPHREGCGELSRSARLHPVAVRTSHCLFGRRHVPDPKSGSAR